MLTVGGRAGSPDGPAPYCCLFIADAYGYIDDEMDTMRLMEVRRNLVPWDAMLSD